MNLLAEQYAEGVAALAAAEATFSCASVPSRDQVARFFLACGAFELVQDDRGGATNCFAAAGALSPSLWVEGYGERLRRHYNASVNWAPGTGVLASAAPPPPEGVFLDGVPVLLPTEATAGLHLLQVGRTHGATWHQVVDVLEDTRTVVALGPSALPKVAREGRRKPGWLLVAGASGLASGAAALGALSQDRAMQQATTPDGVRAAYGRQVGFATASYTLLGTSVAGVTVWAAR